MSYFFTTHFKEALFDDPDIVDGSSFRIRLFRTAPALTSPGAAAWLNASTVAELVTYIGWEEVTGIGGYPDEMMEKELSVRVQGLNNYALFDTYPFYVDGVGGLDEAVGIEGFGIEYVGVLNGITNPLIFVTNTPIGTFTNLDPGDSLAANPDVRLGLAANKWLFAWATPPEEATSLSPIEGPLTIFRSPPLFEASATEHVWLYPQRANMIANPSFEYDNSKWAPMPERVREAPFLPPVSGEVETEADLVTVGDVAVGTVYAVGDDVDSHVWKFIGPLPNDSLTKWQDLGVPTKGGWCGRFTQPGSEPMAIESNVWETRLGFDDYELWTFQLMAKGAGKIKVALVAWDPDYRATTTDWGPETWDLTPDAWIHVKAVRFCPQAHTAMMRIETVSGVGSQELFLDRVLAERGALKEYPYFDGDEKFGGLDDYSWYGGAGRRGVSYSMWYGGRRSVIGRLFATPTDTDAPDDLVTDVDQMAAGMVYDWVPAGVTVIPHMDVFYPTDLRSPLPPRRPNVLPPSTPDDPMGVDDPWTQDTMPQGMWLGSVATIGVSAVSNEMVHGVRPTVTVNKGAGQLDPSTESINVVFEAVFSEPVVGLVAADVIVTGTAQFPSGIPTVVVTGSDANYTITVSGMTTDGTVSVSLPSNAAESLDGDDSQPSTSTDNTVQWFDPLKQTGWWGIGHSGRVQYTKELGGAGRVKLAGAAGNSGYGGALDVEMPLGVYVVSVGESVVASPNAILGGEETWGYGGYGGVYANYGGGSGWTMAHGGGRTELRTAANRSSAVLIAPGGGGAGTSGGGGAGGFPEGLPLTASGGGFAGWGGTGGTQTAAGAAGAGYTGGNSGGAGDTGSGLGAGGRGGNGSVNFGSGSGGGAGGAGKHGGGGGAGGDGDNSRGGGGGSGDVSNAAATYGTYTGVCGGLGLAAMQVRQPYTDRVRQFLASDTPRTYVSAEECAESGCIVVTDLVSGKPFWDREAATIFDGVASTPTQLFQGHTMAGRGAMHVSRIGAQDAPDFQMRAVDAASGMFWNPPAFNAGQSWAIEWTQQTFAGNADGPGCSSVTTPATYGQATAAQIPWKVSATATGISLTVATTALNVTATATAAFASKPTTQFTRYGVSYNHATDTFHFYRSQGYGEASVTATQTRTAAGIPTTGQWNLQTWRPLMFSSVTANAESRIQDVALFDVHRTQAQFFNSFQDLSDSVYTPQTWAGGSTATVGVAGVSNTPAWAIYIPQTWAGSTASVGVAGGSGAMGVVYEYADSAFHDVTVPTGCTMAVLECWGASGGGQSGGGYGAYISADIVDLVPGEVLRLTPGGQPPSQFVGGFNGGGAAGNAGGADGYSAGGSSDIRRGGTTIAERILVGGGGGGSHSFSYTGTGGNAGYPSGFAGTGYASGAGATQTTGNALWQGGSSSTSPGGSRSGGGGGGGYWGGVAGTTGFGIYYAGGGGSSYIAPGLTLKSAETVGTRTGPGRVKVTFLFPQVTTLSYTGGAQTYTVPPGSTSLYVDMSGAEGGHTGGGGGLGGRVRARLAVTPGDVLQVNVGGVGGVGYSFGAVSQGGGFNGGGNAGYHSGGGGNSAGGGGGATDIRRGGTALADRKLVAGGGGGDAYGLSGGAGGSGGGLTGGDGTSGAANAAMTGKGGTPSAGGAAGGSGSAGTLGVGGGGQNGSTTASGGGGGGYYGGGGGGLSGGPSSNGGGGGGSSYTDPAATSVTHTQGYQSGNGVCIITAL